MNHQELNVIVVGRSCMDEHYRTNDELNSVVQYIFEDVVQRDELVLVGLVMANLCVLVTRALHCSLFRLS